MCPVHLRPYPDDTTRVVTHRAGFVARIAKDDQEHHTGP